MHTLDLINVWSLESALHCYLWKPAPTPAARTVDQWCSWYKFFHTFIKSPHVEKVLCTTATEILGIERAVEVKLAEDIGICKCCTAYRLQLLLCLAIFHCAHTEEWYVSNITDSKKNKQPCASHFSKSSISSIIAPLHKLNITKSSWHEYDSYLKNLTALLKQRWLIQSPKDHAKLI